MKKSPALKNALLLCAKVFGSAYPCQVVENKIRVMPVLPVIDGAIKPYVAFGAKPVCSSEKL